MIKVWSTVHFLGFSGRSDSRPDTERAIAQFGRFAFIRSDSDPNQIDLHCTEQIRAHRAVEIWAKTWVVPSEYSSEYNAVTNGSPLLFWSTLLIFFGYSHFGYSIGRHQFFFAGCFLEDCLLEDCLAEFFWQKIFCKSLAKNPQAVQGALSAIDPATIGQYWHFDVLSISIAVIEVQLLSWQLISC